MGCGVPAGDAGWPGAQLRVPVRIPAYMVEVTANAPDLPLAARNRDFTLQQGPSGKSAPARWKIPGIRCRGLGRRHVLGRSCVLVPGPVHHGAGQSQGNQAGCGDPSIQCFHRRFRRFRLDSRPFPASLSCRAASVYPVCVSFMPAVRAKNRPAVGAAATHRGEEGDRSCVWMRRQRGGYPPLKGGRRRRDGPTLGLTSLSFKYIFCCSFICFTYT